AIHLQIAADPERARGSCGRVGMAYADLGCRCGCACQPGRACDSGLEQEGAARQCVGHLQSRKSIEALGDLSKKIAGGRITSGNHRQAQGRHFFPQHLVRRRCAGNPQHCWKQGKTRARRRVVKVLSLRKIPAAQKSRRKKSPSSRQNAVAAAECPPVRSLKHCGDVMHVSLSSIATLLVLSAVGTAHAVEPTNMQQASPIPLVADGQALATRIVRLDPSLDHIAAANTRVTVVKGENYFGVLEGATW